MITRTNSGVRIHEQEFTLEYIKEKIRMSQCGLKCSVRLNGSELSWDEYKPFIREILRVMLS